MLKEPDIISFAQRKLSAVAGINTRARFFLAGGMFKTLLTGHAPRDIDLFAPSEGDRESLVEALRTREARLVQKGPFSDTYKINEHLVELAYKVSYFTLEERLDNFDIALAAVGAEHTAGNWRAYIHPLAQKSISREQVLLIKPLPNWKYALTTLARMRRYASELNFTIPAAEESEIWQVFKNQTRQERTRMIERYKKTVINDCGIAEEAACRFP